MKFTKSPETTFQQLQLNAGILVDAFNPSTYAIGNILGATTGGITFSTNPSYTDFGEDIDNCPNNMMELKKLEYFDPQMSGEFLTCTPALAKQLIGPADVSQTIKVVPRKDVLTTDFHDVWWIGDYSDVNTGDNAGFLAIHLMKALNQSGFEIKSTKNEKGTLSFEFHGHYSMAAQDTVPFEIYCKAGTGTGSTPTIDLSAHVLRMTVGEADQILTATVNPSDETVTWSSSATGKATVSSGTVHAEAAGTSIITAAITVDDVTYTDTCTVIVTA